VSTEPIVRCLDRNHCVATWNRVLIQIWRGEATVEAAQRLVEVGHAFVAENTGHVCNALSIVESTSPPPGDKVRPLLTALFRELSPCTRHQMFVAEGSGFRSALVRGVGLAVSAIAPKLLPFKFASNVEEAALTIGPSLPPIAGGAAALKLAVDAVRAKLDAHG